MTDLIIIAILAALAPTVAAIAALVQAVKTHKAVNSRMTELLELTRAAARAEGSLDEKTAARARKGEAAIQTIADSNSQS